MKSKCNIMAKRGWKVIKWCTLLSTLFPNSLTNSTNNGRLLTSHFSIVIISVPILDSGHRRVHVAIPAFPIPMISIPVIPIPVISIPEISIPVISIPDYLIVVYFLLHLVYYSANACVWGSSYDRDDDDDNDDLNFFFDCIILTPSGLVPIHNRSVVVRL